MAKLQTFNVIGTGSVTREKLSLRYVAFMDDGHNLPMKLIDETGSPEIPAGQRSEFTFGINVDLEQDKHYPLFHETELFDDEKLFLPTLPVIVKYMDIIAGTVREFIRTSPKA